MQYANITTVPKRGSLTLLENERGIFRVDITRSILMRLIYNEKYPSIDSNMSDSQMGGRKGKGCRNNLFIVNGIIHDIMNSKEAKPVLFQQYDYSQMFDSIHLQQAVSDIFEAGLKDDNLSLIYQANREIFMAVNTPGGLSERQRIEDSVLQGDTWGSLLASVQVDSIGQECAEAGYAYNYKNILPVGMLGLVDDITGMTEPGYKAQMLNAFLNVKTAEKGLQFGVKKCKSMLIGKNTEHILNSPLSVDKWDVEHRVEKTTGDTALVETYTGQVEIGQCTEQKYLGFILSSTGDNLVNIRSIRNKSNGTIRKIFTKLESLCLQKYYFETGILFMNIMLRSSILYGCESYYNLKENEIRQLERIEEHFMRKLLKTKKGCPINQIYCELGQIPARFDIYKIQMFFLKYILGQPKTSTISKMVQLQLENPVKGDWVSSCVKNMKNLDINLSFKNIEEMTEYRYTLLVKQNCKEGAYKYIMKKRGTKGSEIEYINLEMADYLLPNNILTIHEQRKIFEIRNKMSDIPSNFCSRDKNRSKCPCRDTETMEHIYECKYLNSEEPKVIYRKIYKGNQLEQKHVFKRFEENMELRTKHLNEESSHAIPSCDPLVISNG